MKKYGWYKASWFNFKTKNVFPLFSMTTINVCFLLVWNNTFKNFYYFKNKYLSKT